MAIREVQLQEGITLIRDASNPSLHRYEVDNKKANLLAFTVDFTGSTGLSVQGVEGLVVTAEVSPFERKLVALAQIAPGARAMQKFRFIAKPPPPGTKLPPEVQAAQNRINAAMQESCAILQRTNVAAIDPAVFRNTQAGHMVDPFFPPAEGSVYDGTTDAHNLMVQFRRPKDFFTGNFALFLNEIEPNDIKQGSLGDCWFMCSIASLAERKNLVERLFLTRDVCHEGVYRIRFCKGGEWQTVTIDDYIPCSPGAGPVFSRSHGNELWVMLMEKAYAKLHGSYFLLKGGWAHEGMMDLTGCPTRNYEFDNEDVKTMIKEDYLWPLLRHYDDDGCMLSASTPGEDRWTDNRGSTPKGGLVAGHAYSVIQVKEAYGYRLLNIRNPWGSFEWDGDWSDTSLKWTPRLKKAINPVLDDKDGTFWMSYEDFLKYFSSITICLVKKFREARIKGLFRKAKRNDVECIRSEYYYTLRVNQPTRVFIGVHQEDERILGVEQKRPYLDLGLVLLSQKEGKMKLCNRTPNVSERQVEMEVMLKPGREYLVLPRTSGCSMQREAGNYTPEPLLVGDTLSPLMRSTLKDIFRRANIEISEDLSYQEFSMLMGVAEAGVTQEDFNSLLKTFPSTDKGLTYEGFCGYFQNRLASLGEVSSTQPAIRGWLQKWGYTEDLYSNQGRCFVLTIHSEAEEDAPVLTVKRAEETGLDQRVNNLILQLFGSLKSRTGSVSLYQLQEK